MRNWNADVKKAINEVLKTFLDYLWGIETIAYSDYFLMIFLVFLDYLRGIETPYTREVLKILYDDGWREIDIRTRGSHMQLKHPIKSGKVTVPKS